MANVSTIIENAIRRKVLLLIKVAEAEAMGWQTVAVISLDEL